MNRIRFYRPDEPYGFLANVFESPFFLDGYRWPTVEHYYQAQKFFETGLFHKIREADTPYAAKVIARENRCHRYPNWNRQKLKVMKRAVRAKFTQNSNLLSQLLATGSVELIEAASDDSFWGDGADGRGANNLGRILMEIRQELQIEWLQSKIQPHACRPEVDNV